MESLRTLTTAEGAARTTCDRCQATGCPWDRIGGVSICPDCQELLVRGESEPMSFCSEPRPCTACAAPGTVTFITVPLRARAVAMDLCPAHLRGLLGRSLDPEAYQTIVRQLRATGLAPGRIFLLHEAFYDRQGRALQPVRNAC